MSVPFAAVLVDIDGTLIDSNDAHAVAWTQALREHGVAARLDQVRPLIGMGADRLLPAVAGLDEHSPAGTRIAHRKRQIFDDALPALRPTRGARALVEFLRARGIDLVVATSAGREEADALLKRAGVDDLIRARTSADDAEESKPDPEIVHAALARVEAAPAAAVLIGDTPYDIDAAARAGVAAIALRCGGHWSDHDLRGAIAVLDDPAALLAHWGGAVQARRRGHTGSA